MSDTGVKSKVGKGMSIVNRRERTYHRGTLMFIEGESSTNMFIIRSGLVRILKQEGESTVELAQLGPGSVLGELSLLDHQPRSATAQVVEETVVTIIDEELFTRTLQNLPSWLSNMIHLVVKRLRDTLKKTTEDIVTKSIAGVIQVILLLAEGERAEGSSKGEVFLTTVKERVYAVIGIGGAEVENVLLHLILKEMIVIRKDGAGKEYVVSKNSSILRLYMGYLRMHQRGGTLIGEQLSDATFELMGIFVACAERQGKRVTSRLVSISKQQVEIELQRRGMGKSIDADALDQLIDAKLLMLQDATTESTHGHHSQVQLLFDPEIIGSVAILRVWLPIFREDVRL